MVPGVSQVLSIYMALQKLAFGLARALGRQNFIPFSVKGARSKMHALTSIAIFFSILGPIWINPFSVTPYKYVKCHIFVWVANLTALCDYRRFNKWSDFFGSPGSWRLLSLSRHGSFLVRNSFHVQFFFFPDLKETRERCWSFFSVLTIRALCLWWRFYPLSPFSHFFLFLALHFLWWAGNDVSKETFATYHNLRQARDKLGLS